VLRKCINGTEYFFIDTPGFNDTISASTTFEQTIVLLYTIQNHTILVGIWYVVNSTKQCTEIDALAIEWIHRLWGECFFPYITITITHCDASLSLQEPEELDGLLTLTFQLPHS
jgi:GTP-binding protein EngB required for normal cell division